MQSWPRHRVTASALCAAALVVGGCQAQSSAPERTQSSAVAPQSKSVPLPAAPPTQPSAGLVDLDARMQKATDDAASATGADIRTVVLDRTTGQVVSDGGDRPFPIASVVKLFIADDLLLQVAQGETTLTPADRQQLDIMLRSSDDSAAQNFWDRSGGNAVIGRVVARYGLTGTTAPYNGHWDVTQSTANDLVRYYAKLLDGSGGLPREQADIILGNLAQSTPTGTDGYPQRFGIPEGLDAEPVAVKQGWFCCWNGGNQLHVSTGVIGADRRYVMAIGSLDPTSEAGARKDITEAVETMFPGGRI
ncbi:MAG: serine hydrolase [Mycobacterium kyogaense]|uniref:serine hydrolase n=1 Tax=Mycobacterium kyogaense TaxID=2212479 RepID=UPI002FF7F3FB